MDEAGALGRAGGAALVGVDGDDAIAPGDVMNVANETLAIGFPLVEAADVFADGVGGAAIGMGAVDGLAEEGAVRAVVEGEAVAALADEGGLVERAVGEGGAAVGGAVPLGIVGAGLVKISPATPRPLEVNLLKS